MERWVGLVWLKHSGQFTYKAVNHRSRDQHHHHWAMPQNTYNESESTEYVGLRDSTVALKQLAEGFARCPVTNIPDKYLRRPEPKSHNQKTRFSRNQIKTSVQFGEQTYFRFIQFTHTIIHADDKYILQFIICNTFYAVDICCYCSSVIYI